MKFIINAAVFSLSCSLVVGSSAITIDDLRETRIIVSQECAGDADHALINKEDQYVFGLVQEIQKNFH